MDAPSDATQAELPPLQDDSGMLVGGMVMASWQLILMILWQHVHDSLLHAHDRHEGRRRCRTQADLDIPYGGYYHVTPATDLHRF